MNVSETPSALSSGLIELTPEAIDELPDSPGWFRLRSPGQRVMYVADAADAGLRAAVRGAAMSRLVAGIAFLEYEGCDDAAAARAGAERDIARLKPLYNDGFGRYRATDVTLPKAGHCTRQAMPNP